MLPFILQLPKRLWSFLPIVLLPLVIMVACAGKTTTIATSKVVEKATNTPSVQPISPEYTTIPAQLDLGSPIMYTLPRFALDGADQNAVILLSFPLKDPPTDDDKPLYQDNTQVVIGNIATNRDISISDTLKLPEASYWVVVRQNAMVFINVKTNEKLVTSIVPDIQSLVRDVNPPETIITTQDLCYSWHHVQVCTPPSPLNALTDEEKSRIKMEIQTSEDKLVEKGLIEKGLINIDGVISDMVGKEAVNKKEASLLAAPTVDFPSKDGDQPVDGALLGVFDVLLPIQVDGYPDIITGTYIVSATKGEDGWYGILTSTDGDKIKVPAEYLEVRAKIEKPMAILVGIRLILCWFECKR